MQKSEQLKFKFSTELKNILGRDLITNDYVAILELVKNSYDAMASLVEIEFCSNKIIIADNGKGMSKDDLIHKWLFIGYSAKRDGTEDKDFDTEDYHNKLRRAYAGAKGIGRLSCDRLAQKVNLITKSQESDTTVELTVDWRDFEVNQNKEMGEIPIPCKSYSSIPTFPENSLTGTILELSDLNEDWSTSKIQALRKSLEKMINPFSEVKDFEIIVTAKEKIAYDEEIREKINKLEHEEESHVLTDAQYKDLAEFRSKVINGPIENTIAHVLDIKTTKIESRLLGNKITTKLIDRGIDIYEIEEENSFSKLEDVSINLYYLNRAAKVNFSRNMGVQPVQYGSVFLFRNGFRILPYGNETDDSWQLDHRAQQGYNRTLGTRDLFGRVDVETDHIDEFKEVSSREGGLIKSDSSDQLFDFFTRIHRRLERYVVGVLWGEGFKKNSYFKNAELADSQRALLKNKDKDSLNADNIFKIIGSKVDFVQIVRGLVNDKNIKVLYYNETLADIVSNVSDVEKIQDQFIDNFKQLAESTNNVDLLAKLENFEKELSELYEKQRDTERKLAEEERKRRQAEQVAEEEAKRRRAAELAAEEERKAKIQAELERKYAENKRLEEELRRKNAELKKKEEEIKRRHAEQQAAFEKKAKEKAEQELDEKTRQNLFLQSVGNLDTERILKYHHDIRIHSLTISNTLARFFKMSNNGTLDSNELTKLAIRIAKANNKIMSIAQFATKANFNIDCDEIEADIVNYITEYVNQVLPDFYDDCKLVCNGNNCTRIMRFKPLEVSLLIDNLLANSVKAKSKTFTINFSNLDENILMSVEDSGTGLSEKISKPDLVFEKGISTTNGSGLGLYNIAKYVKETLKGSISVDSSLRRNEGFKLNIIF